MKHLTALKKTVLWSVFNRASATLLRFKEYCENVLFKVTHLRYITTRFFGLLVKSARFQKLFREKNLAKKRVKRKQKRTMQLESSGDLLSRIYFSLIHPTEHLFLTSFNLTRALKRLQV